MQNSKEAPTRAAAKKKLPKRGTFIYDLVFVGCSLLAITFLLVRPKTLISRGIPRGPLTKLTCIGLISLGFFFLQIAAFSHVSYLIDDLAR